LPRIRDSNREELLSLAGATVRLSKWKGRNTLPINGACCGVKIDTSEGCTNDCAEAAQDAIKAMAKRILIEILKLSKGEKVQSEGRSKFRWLRG
jgi:hypothetical protein